MAKQVFDILYPDTLQISEKECLIQHLIFSSQLKNLWQYGNSIIYECFNKKRKRKRVLYNKFLRHVIRLIRYFAKYEILRSSLECILFDQVEVEYFLLDGIEKNISMTEIYFSTSSWDINESSRTEQITQTTQTTQTNQTTTHIDSTHIDVMKIIYYLFMIENVITNIYNYIVKKENNINSKWKQRVIKQLRQIHKKLYSTMSLLFVDIINK